MKDKLKKYLMIVTMAVGILLSTVMPAFAYTGGAGQTETNTSNVGTVTGNSSAEEANSEDAPITEEPSGTGDSEEEESQGRVQGTPLSVPGNGQLVDDLADDGSKQFLTIQTKNGNTFFMVLDRSNNTENVYMLSMIDENDLAEFLDGTEKEPELEQPSVVIPETEQPTVLEEPETEEKSEETKGGMNLGALLAVAVLLAGGIGGYYYFKVLKPRQDEEEADSEDLEFFGGAYVNEEQDDTDEEEEDE